MGSSPRLVLGVFAGELHGKQDGVKQGAKRKGIVNVKGELGKWAERGRRTNEEEM